MAITYAEYKEAKSTLSPTKFVEWQEALPEEDYNLVLDWWVEDEMDDRFEEAQERDDLKYGDDRYF